MISGNVKRSKELKKTARTIIRRRMLYAAGLGVIPFPIVDAAGILAVQVVMIKDLAKVYDIPFKEQLVKSFIGSLAGSMSAMSVVKTLPVMGSIIGAVAVSVSGAASTYAIGKVFVHHFDLGGTLLDFDPVKSQQYFKKLYEEGAKEAVHLKEEKKIRTGKMTEALKPSNGETPPPATNGSSFSNPITNFTKSTNWAKKREAKAKAKARHKKIILKKRRRAARLKKLKKYTFLLLIIGVGGYYYYQQTMKYSSKSTEIDLYMKEASAKQVDLKAVANFDSLSNAKIASFPLNSTEGVINYHIQNKEATYPKRYSLSAVRFVGKSDALSAGAVTQLQNIALLMKKYPDLKINLYGHTTDIGPEFSRQKTGRARARVLKDAVTNFGISSYRLTGNYIEKSAGTHDEYWGAEIVIDVTTEESAVAITAPVIPTQPRSIISSFVRKINKTEEEKPSPEESSAIVTEVDTTMQATDLTDTLLVKQDTILDEIQEDLISDIDSTAMDSTAMDSVNVEPERVDSVTIDSTVIEEPIKESIEEDTVQAEALPPPPKKKGSVPQTTANVMVQYLESANPTFPKIFSLSNVVFTEESEDLNTKAEKQLVKIAALMKKYPSMKIEIYAHISNGGSGDTSQEEKAKVQLKWQDIGLRRARAIKKFLHENGTSNRKISTNFRLQRKEPTEKYWGAEIVIINK